MVREFIKTRKQNAQRVMFTKKPKAWLHEEPSDVQTPLLQRSRMLEDTRPQLLFDTTANFSGLPVA